MLHYVAMERYLSAFEGTRALCPPALRRRIRLVSYEELLRARRLPPGTWLFTDFERLTAPQAEAAARVQQAIQTAGWPTLNHPTRSRKRYELLRLLHEAGLNPYDVYRASEHRWPGRYPVFVRHASDHRGPATQLLADRAALQAALDARDAAGQAPDESLVVEFCDTADAHGIYRKYGAYCVAGQILPRHLQFGRHWMLKTAGSAPEPAQLAEEHAYLTGNPHHSALREIFACARIQYGRIDYTLAGAVPVVFEINSNPSNALVPDHVGDPRRATARAHFRTAYLAALQTLARPVPGTSIPAPRAAIRTTRRSLPRRMRRWLRAKLRAARE